MLYMWSSSVYNDGELVHTDGELDHDGVALVLYMMES